MSYHPQQLTNDFRYNYAQFWHSILKADLEGIKQSADSLGVGKLYGLFACMVTGRSWGSIQKGIDKAEKNSAEVGIFEKITIMYIMNLISLMLFFLEQRNQGKRSKIRQRNHRRIGICQQTNDSYFQDQRPLEKH